jgi:anaerobic selenocysteine-containing dehydrogenase
LCSDLERLRSKFSLHDGLAAGDAGHDRSALLLIGRRDLRSNNSWMHNSGRLVKGEERCTLLMHPEDARQRGVADGERVRVTSRVGSITLAVELTTDIMPGVVSLPHGWGHAREGVQMRTAQRHPGVSVNDITDETAIDALSGTAAFNGLPVTVEPLAPSR